ncbi:MAG: DUF4369 domain-containing protein [Bacteroidetes bacterium]|nr:DUF4369 domain-containing protein [Bacteroidota bacterium]
MLKPIVSIVQLVFLILMAGLTSCNHAQDSNARIAGILTNAQEMQLILLEMDTRSILPVDSAILENTGAFAFNLKIKEPGFWLLKAPTGKILVLIIHPGDQLELYGSANEFPDNVKIKGTTEAMTLHGFYAETRKEELLVDSFENELSSHQEDADYFQISQKIDTALRQIWERQRNREICYINKFPGSLSSLVVINYAFGMSPVLSPEDDFAYYAKLDSALNLNFPENKHVKYHHQRVLEHRRKKKE